MIYLRQLLHYELLYGRSYDRGIHDIKLTNAIKIVVGAKKNKTAELSVLEPTELIFVKVNVPNKK